MARIYNEQVTEPFSTSTEYLPRICLPVSTSTEYLPRICIPISEPIDEPIDEPISEPLGTSTEYLPRICIPISEPISEPLTATTEKRTRRSCSRRLAEAAEESKTVRITILISKIICGLLWCYGIGLLITRTSEFTPGLIIMNILVGFLFNLFIAPAVFVLVILLRPSWFR